MKFSEKLYFNEDIFLFILNEQLYIWDYKKHQQYKIEKPQIIVDILNGKIAIDDEQLVSFLQEGIIVNSKPKSQAWNWDILSKIYHIGTQDLTPDLAQEDYKKYLHSYFQFIKNIENTKPLHKKIQGTRISLPVPNFKELDHISLGKILKKRKTCRNFYGSAIKLEKVTTILHICFGVNETISDHHQRRYTPSGGNLKSAEGYLVNFSIETIEQGIYYYDYLAHELVCIQQINLKDSIADLLQGQYCSQQLSFGIFVSSRLDLLSWKYKHSRAYRVALLDIGHISQNFQLTSTALGIDSWITGAFKDTAINQLLKINNIDESVLFFLGGGIGNYHSYDVDFEQIRAHYFPS